MAGPMRQHYNLACGGALTQVEGGKKVLQYAKGGVVNKAKDTPQSKAVSGTGKKMAFAKGGKVSAYFTATNASGKKVGSTDRIGNKPAKHATFGEGQFKKGVNVSGLSGDDKFTSVTQKKSQLAPGFKVQKP